MNISQSEPVTWLMAVKNGMPFLPQTLASIADQTYDEHKIIVWENGSSDSTLEELHRWIPSKIPGVIVSGRSMPLAQSLAALVEEAETELCARIDADDIAAPDRLRMQVDFLREHPEVAVVGSQMREIDEAGEALELRRPYPVKHDDIVNTMLLENPMGHPAVLFRRSAILQAGNYRPVPIAEDFDLWMRVAMHYRLANLDEPLMSYRVHAGSATRIQLGENRLESAMHQLIADQSPALFGLPSSIALRLRRRKLPLAVGAIQKVAAYLDATQGRKTGETLRQTTFIDSMRCLVGPWDRVSIMFLARNDPRPDVFSRELRQLAHDLSPKMGLMKNILPLLRRMKDRQDQQKMRRWAEQLGRSASASIDGSLTVTGRQDFSEYIAVDQHGWIEKDVTIWISQDEGANPQLTIARRTFIGQNTFIGVYQPVSIGSHTMIGAYSYIISANHKYARRDIPIGEQGFVGAPVVLEDDVWLGTHVVVLPGVTIGKGAIVAAGSIVNKSIPPYEIWGGAPARFIKERP